MPDATAEGAQPKRYKLVVVNAVGPGGHRCDRRLNDGSGVRIPSQRRHPSDSMVPWAGDDRRSRRDTSILAVDFPETQTPTGIIEMSEVHDEENPDRLDEVLAEYMQRADRGEVVDREQFIAEHPEVADGLRAFFADFDAIQSAAERTEPDQPRPAGDPGTPLGVVQYFGDYQLLRELGRGGMGVVYLARQSSLCRLVAVKMILGKYLDSLDSVERFRREAEAAANLQHPGIVAIH